MLGLLDDPAGLSPCYRLDYTAREVFVDATKAIISQSQKLDILAYASEACRNDTLNLPSWVPDFSRHPEHRSLHTDQEDIHGSASVKALGSLSRSYYSEDETGRKDSVLNCWMLELGPLATEATLGVVGQISPTALSVEDIEADWRERMVACGIGPKYKYTGQDADFAMSMCIGCGEKRLPSKMLDGSLGPYYQGTRSGDHELRHLDHSYESMLIGTWRFFAGPRGWIGIAPAASRYDDVLACLFEADDPISCCCALVLLVARALILAIA